MEIKKKRKWLRPVLFTFGGASAGFLYYYFIGCTNGSCAIVSNPYNAMVYMGIIGWLLSSVFEKKEGK